MEEAKNEYSWFRPKNASEAADTLNQVTDVIAFLSDTLLVKEDGEHLEFSAEGSGELYFILAFIEETMRYSLELITKQQETKVREA